MKRRIDTFINNHGIETNYIEGLSKGDELICKKSVNSNCDVGLSSTVIKYQSFIPGNLYTVDHLFNWDGCIIAYVSDEDGVLWVATPEIFEM